jgi:hypothetical protein
MFAFPRTRRRSRSWITTLALLVTACSSSTGNDDDDGGFFMRFDANGTRVTYTNEATLFATFTQSGAQHSAVFTGYDANSNMALQVYSDAPIAANTYSGYTLSGTVFVGALIGYEDATGTLYTQGTGTSIQSQIVLTSVTSESVRGTFSGTLKAAGQPDVVVTNGEFLVRRFN